jgi:hypothetical protein
MLPSPVKEKKKTIDFDFCVIYNKRTNRANIHSLHPTRVKDEETTWRINPSSLPGGKRESNRRKYGKRVYRKTAASVSKDDGRY